MANTILTPSIIAKESLAVLRKNAVMANLVHRDYSEEFAAVGDTITVRKPNKFVAKEYPNVSGGIDVQDITETGVQVKMDKLLDVSFAVTAKEMALSIDDFSTKYLVPAMQAFADKIDSYLIGLETGVTNRVTATAAKADMIAARQFLTNAAAPLTDRSYVYNADTEAGLLSTDLFVNASAVGDEGTALREASLGKKFGMNCYVDQNIATAASTGDAAAIAFHKDAFALVTRPLALPLGSSNAHIENYDGFALRVVYGYDMEKKTDTISIDMLCGVTTLNKDLAAVVQK